MQGMAMEPVGPDGQTLWEALGGRSQREVIGGNGQRRWVSSCKTMGGDSIGCKIPFGGQHDRPKLGCHDGVNANRSIGKEKVGVGGGPARHRGGSSGLDIALSISCICNCVLNGSFWRTTPSYSDTTEANIAHRLFWGWTKQQYNMFRSWRCDR